MNRDLYLQQAGLKSLGHDPGPLDGIPGPRTSAARAAWEASLDRPAPRPSGNTIPRLLVDLAIADIGIKETSRNQGPGIAKYWEATTYPAGYKNREPYCAAAVCYWIREACTGRKVPFDLPRSALAFDFLTWPSRQLNQGLLYLNKRADLLPGDIIVWEFSHVSVLEHPAPKAQTQLRTIDANTSPESSNNEGGGVYRRTRARTLVRGVVRITA
jgi:peptidoglycan hydrolase-like protein with peptidoglycan-binding domain